jgi:hypothetical protein
MDEFLAPFDLSLAVYFCKETSLCLTTQLARWIYYVLGYLNIFLYLFLFFLDGHNCLSYAFSNLQSVPEDIPAGVVILNLTDNNITVVTIRDTYSQLEELKMQRNHLSYIEDKCFKGTILQGITLTDNLLTRFPDFSEVKRALLHINLVK